jgi:hypothetical protein
MRANATDLPVRLEANGVRILGQDWGGMDVGRLHVPAGGDTTPLLEGLPGDLCQCPHWGLLLDGTVHVRYDDGSEETVHGGRRSTGLRPHGVDRRGFRVAPGQPARGDGTHPRARPLEARERGDQRRLTAAARHDARVVPRRGRRWTPTS